MFKIKSLYEAPEKDDEFRILVERSWPSGVSEDEAKVDLWIKDIAPSNDLRKWFEDSDNWDEFQKKYLNELKAKKELIKQLKILEKFHNTMTLVYSTNDDEQNSATVLLELLTKPPKVIKTNIPRIHG